MAEQFNALSMTENDLAEMVGAIFAEARDQGYPGMLAAGNVIANRAFTDYSRYGTSVAAQVTATRPTRQFSAVHPGNTNYDEYVAARTAVLTGDESYVRESERAAFRTARDIGLGIRDGTLPDNTWGATAYWGGVQAQMAETGRPYSAYHQGLPMFAQVGTQTFFGYPARIQNHEALDAAARARATPGYGDTPRERLGAPFPDPDETGLATVEAPAVGGLLDSAPAVNESGLLAGTGSIGMSGLGSFGIGTPGVGSFTPTGPSLNDLGISPIGPGFAPRSDTGFGLIGSAYAADAVPQTAPGTGMFGTGTIGGFSSVGAFGAGISPDYAPGRLASQARAAEDQSMAALNAAPSNYGAGWAAAARSANDVAATSPSSPGYGTGWGASMRTANDVAAPATPSNYGSGWASSARSANDISGTDLAAVARSGYTGADAPGIDYSASIGPAINSADAGGMYGAGWASSARAANDANMEAAPASAGYGAGWAGSARAAQDAGMQPSETYSSPVSMGYGPAASGTVGMSGLGSYGVGTSNVGSFAPSDTVSEAINAATAQTRADADAHVGALGAGLNAHSRDVDRAIESQIGMMTGETLSQAEAAVADAARNIGAAPAQQSMAQAEGRAVAAPGPGVGEPGYGSLRADMPGVSAPTSTAPAVGAAAGVASPTQAQSRPATAAPAAVANQAQAQRQAQRAQTAVATATPGVTRAQSAVSGPTARAAETQSMAAYNAAVDQAMGWSVPNAARSVGESVVAAGLGAPSAGYSYGYSPVGTGVSQVHNSAPESVQIAATGPGVFGAFADQFGQPMTGLGSYYSGVGSFFSGLFGTGTNDGGGGSWGGFNASDVTGGAMLDGLAEGSFDDDGNWSDGRGDTGNGDSSP